MAKININLTKAKIETQKEELILGIDLGTTNSLIAYIKDGQPFCIKNGQNSSSLLPSVVYFDENNQPIVGAAAKEMLLSQPERVIFSVKRLLGKSMPEIAAHKDFFSYKIVENNDPNALVKVRIGDNYYNPIELSALILKELKNIAEKELKQPVSKCVITVPAYFDDNQRQATRDAGKLAGLDVLRVVNEPTAAALAYGLSRDLSVAKTIAVYDLGGGTFDCSILRVENGFFEVLSSNGDTFLGGDDIDRLLMEFICKKYMYVGKYFEQNPQSNELRHCAEQAKKQLSAADDFYTDIVQEKIHISRQELEELIRPLYEKTLKCGKNALADAQLTPQEIDEVIMVGGSSRIPYIQQQLGAFFGKKVNTSVNPDEVVALGAAIQANILAGKDKNTILLDVTPLSLGIETVGGLMDTIISRNTKIPTSLARTYTTSIDGQSKLKVAVYQGERELVANNRKLGEFILSDIPPMPAGLPKIEIQFLLNADGILNIRAKELRSGVAQAVEMRSLYQISAADMAKMLKDSVQNAQEDIKTRALIEAQTEGRLLVAAAAKFLKQNEAIFNPTQRSEYEKLADFLNIKINETDKDAIHAAMDALNDYARPFAEIAMDNTVADAMQGKKLG